MFLILLLSFSMPLMDTVVVNKSLSIGPEDTLYISVDNGNISLIGTKGNKVKIKSLLIYPRGKEIRRPDLKVSKFPHKIVVEGKVKAPNMYSKTDLVVYIPENVVTMAVVVNGHVNIDGINGRITVQNTNGGIEFRGIRGTLSLKCTNGGVSGEVSREDTVIIQSANGPVNLKIDAEKPLIRVHAAHGEVYSDFPLNKKEGKPVVRIVASNGDVYIRKK